MLTEAIISMLLISLAGMGITYVVSSVSASQREFKVQQLVVNELRSKVQNRSNSNELCGSGSLSTSNFATEIQVINGCAPTKATITLPSGVATEIVGVSAPIVLSANPENIGSIVVGASVNGN